jgi:hypothetical protein
VLIIRVMGHAYQSESLDAGALVQWAGHTDMLPQLPHPQSVSQQPRHGI